MADKAASGRNRLSSRDASFIFAQTHDAPLQIGAILIFEGDIDFHDFTHHIESLLHLAPRYRRRMMRVPFNMGYPIMEDDAKFRIANHVIRHVLPAGIGRPEAVDEVLRQYEVPLDYNRPLWELHSFENFEQGRTAILFKVHHAMVDGVSGVELLKVMFDLRQKPQAIRPSSEPWQIQQPSNAIGRLLEATRDLAATQTKALIQVLRELIRDPRKFGREARNLFHDVRLMARIWSRHITSTPWNSGLVGPRRALAWSIMSFEDCRRIRNAFGGSINDLVLTILSEAAARYLRYHGYKPDGQFSIGCPVNVRHEEPISLGNRVAVMLPLLPAEPMDVVERLKCVKAETQRIKEAQLPLVVDRLLAAGANIPPPVMGLGLRLGALALRAATALFKMSGYKPRPDRFLLPTRGMNFIATDIPGVQVPQYLLGNKCLEQIPLIPCYGTRGYNAAVLSYNSTLCFAMIADPNLMPDVSQMKFFVDEAFSELKKRANSAGMERDPASSATQSAAAGAA